MPFPGALPATATTPFYEVQLNLHWQCRWQCKACTLQTASAGTFRRHLSDLSHVIHTHGRYHMEVRPLLLRLDKAGGTGSGGGGAGCPCDGVIDSPPPPHTSRPPRPPPPPVTPTPAPLQHTPHLNTTTYAPNPKPKSRTPVTSAPLSPLYTGFWGLGVLYGIFRGVWMPFRVRTPDRCTGDRP